MSGRIIGVTAVLAAIAFIGGGAAAQEAPTAAPAETPFPLPLELTVPHPPTVFSADGGNHLVYEIYLRNFGGPLTLQRLEVLDATDPARAPVAVFEGEAFSALLQPISRRAEGDEALSLPAGGSTIVYISVALDAGARVPATLRHRLLTDAASTYGAVTEVHQMELPVFGPPVRGSGWRISGGPDNSAGHRRGVIVFEGRAQISRRYAIDWMQVEDGATFAGDPLDNASYHAYGEEVLAVADGTVVSVRDGSPENVPGESPRLTSLDGVPGNFITLDLGDGIFARYLHLQPGSLSVQTGDRVQRGQSLGRIGNSGDSREPHLHFEITTTPTLLGGEGAPYLIEEFWTAPSEGGALEHRVRELPVPDGERIVVSFEAPAGG